VATTVVSRAIGSWEFPLSERNAPTARRPDFKLTDEAKALSPSTGGSLASVLRESASYAKLVARQYSPFDGHKPVGRWL
jgi:hypothetical protein